MIHGDDLREMLFVMVLWLGGGSVVWLLAQRGGKGIHTARRHALETREVRRAN